MRGVCTPSRYIKECFVVVILVLKLPKLITSAWRLIMSSRHFYAVQYILAKARSSARDAHSLRAPSSILLQRNILRFFKDAAPVRRVGPQGGHYVSSDDRTYRGHPPVRQPHGAPSAEDVLP